MSEPVIVNIGDMKWAQGEGELVTYALGSCVGVTFYDSVVQVGALLHVLLPERTQGADGNPMKYADSGVRATLEELAKHGFSKARATVKLAGGAGMFSASEESISKVGMIGDRNIAGVRKALREAGLSISAEDVGGTAARTMFLDVKTGAVTVKTVGKAARYL